MIINVIIINRSSGSSSSSSSSSSRSNSSSSSGSSSLLSVCLYCCLCSAPSRGGAGNARRAVIRGGEIHININNLKTCVLDKLDFLLASEGVEGCHPTVERVRILRGSVPD